MTALVNEQGQAVERYAYSPWGERINPSNLSMRDTRYLKLTRGYTMHEHLDMFGIINMNGRVYDPLTAMFFSPDPYLQSPGNWLNYNRYTYCLNNPFKYVDPSGEKWWQWTLLAVADALTGGFISISAMTTALSASVAANSVAVTGVAMDFSVTFFGTLFTGDSAWGGKRFENSLNLFGGLFQTDENKNFGENALLLLSRFAWEEPQTRVGYGWSLIRNSIGNVDRVDYLGGATFVTKENSTKGPAISLGNYINADIVGEITDDFDDYVIGNEMYMHEYGHTFDSRRFGPAYLFGIGIPSIFSAATSEPVSDKDYSDTHDAFWTETRANKWAKKYFEKYYGVTWDFPNYPLNK